MRFLNIGITVVGLSFLTIASISPTLAKQPIISQDAKRVFMAQTLTQVTTYSFPKEDITYSTNGTFNYKGRIFSGSDVSIVNSDIGEQVTVNLSHGIDTVTKFTLLLPNGLFQDGDKIKAVGITDNFVAPNRNNDSYILLNGTVEISP